MLARTRRCAVAAVAIAGLVVPSTASAAPTCARPASGAAVKLAQVSGWVESIIVDAKGRMFGTNLDTGQIFRIDRPGAAPVTITGDVKANGGIVVRRDGMLLVGTQNNGPLVTDAKILLVDPGTGAVSTYAHGLGGIDGIALAPDGTVYTTTFGGTAIGRVTARGDVDPVWAKVTSPNGVAVSPDNRYVYVIQTAPAPHLYRIPISDPSHPTVWVSAGPQDALALPDGLTLDRRGRPLIATHLGGEIWRVENKQFCTVKAGEFGSTQITYGHGPQGFSAGHLYRTGIDGSIDEIPAR